MMHGTFRIVTLNCTDYCYLCGKKFHFECKNPKLLDADDRVTIALAFHHVTRHPVCLARRIRAEMRRRKKDKEGDQHGTEKA